MKNLVDKVLHRAGQLDRMVDGFVNDKLRGNRVLTPKELLEGIVAEASRAVTLAPEGPAFPWNRMTITLAAPTPERGIELRRTLTPEAIQQAILSHLDGRASLPHDLRVKVAFSTSAAAPYAVAMRTVAVKDLPAPPAAPAAARLVSADGSIRFTLAEGIVNIGRVPQIHGRDGKMIRRNQLVLDGQDASDTVSRMHARIQGTRDGTVLRFTLFDDGSQRGSVVVRNGQPHKVVPGPAGFRLKDGDELYFGKARLQFVVRGTRA